jgi:hypothetical protein
MAASHKKVVVRLVDGMAAWGYLPPGGWLRGDAVELMQVDGRAKSLTFNQIEAIYYVRDFNLDDPLDPERLGRRAFLGRPREEGLWVRVNFGSQTPLEGLVVVDFGMLDGLVEDRGLYLSPPDGRGNTLRIYIPRHAMRSMEVLGLIASPARKQAAKAAERAAMEVQAGLFDE